jgi:hypothetical protein
MFYHFEISGYEVRDVCDDGDRKFDVGRLKANKWAGW